MRVREAYYRVLDMDIRLLSDSEVLLNAFQQDYAQFQVSHNGQHSQISLTAELESEGADPRLSINDVRISLQGHTSPISYAHQRIVQALFDHLRDFLVLHAGVVARGNGALLITGPSGSGKSTLVLNLLEAGFTFFSDDICPIHLHTGRVHPFPRSIWVTPNTREFRGSGPIGGEYPTARKKVPLVPDELRLDVANTPLKPTWLICIDPGDGDATFCKLEIGMRTGSGNGLRRDLSRLSGVIVTPYEQGLPALTVSYPRGAGLTGKIEDLLRSYQCDIWNAYSVSDVSPNFEGIPKATRLPIHEAAFRLLDGLRGIPNLGQGGTDVAGNRTGIYLKLVDLLQGVQCWSLKSGRLDIMIERIKQVAKDIELR